MAHLFHDIQKQYDSLKGLVLKDAQKDAINQIFDRKSSVFQLHTGYGKSMIYTIAPLILSQVCNHSFPHYIHQC